MEWLEDVPTSTTATAADDQHNDPQSIQGLLSLSMRVGTATGRGRQKPPSGSSALSDFGVVAFDQGSISGSLSVAKAFRKQKPVW